MDEYDGSNLGGNHNNCAVQMVILIIRGEGRKRKI